MTRSALVLILGAAAMSAGCARTPEVEGSTPSAAAGEGAALAQTGAVAATEALLATLDPAKRQQTVYPFDDAAQKVRWSNLPTGIFERRGLRFGDLTPAQLQAAHALLRTALSEQGYRKVVEIMAGDEHLRTTSTGGGGGRLNFGDDEYYLAILGTPSTTTPWMIQFGGHHLAINLTMAGQRSSMTPSLPATQPATFAMDGRIVRPLGDEYDKAMTLIAALDASQRAEAVIGAQMRDLVLGPGQDGKTIQPEGIRASRLSAAQQAMLWDLASEWVNIQGEPGASTKMAEIRANLADTWFAWSGGTTRGTAAYFRIQGPTLVIEYAPQRPATGTDQGVDHVHTIYRDPTNDYGARLASAGAAR